MQSKKELFSKFPGDVFAVSTASVEQHKKLKEQLGLDYPLVSDKDFLLIKKADLVNPSEPQSLRGFAILDKKGNVIHSQEIDPFGEEAPGIISFAVKKITATQ